MKYLALVALVLPVLAHGQEIAKPRLTVLDNGMRIVSVEDHKSPLVSAVWSAHVGDSAEPSDFGGNSHYLEHLLLFRGTKDYPGNAIGDRVSGRGGYFNGHTWYDWTTFEIVLPSDELDDILDMHEQMMFHAAFDGEDFETEKKAVFEELRSGKDRPYGYLWRAAPYHMYAGETFYSRSTIGTIEKVQAATVTRVRRYYRDYYVPNNMTLAVVGDFDTEALLDRVTKRFGRYAHKRVPAPTYEALPLKPGVTVVAEEREVGKSYFLVAFEGPAMASPDHVPFEVLMSYLGDGKTAPLRETLVHERKLFEQISTESLPRRFQKGWQPITGEGQPDKVAAGIDGLLEVLGRVRAEGVPAEQLELTQKRLMTEHRVEMEDSYQYAMAIATGDAHGDYRSVSEYEARVARVTPEDVWTVAKKYLGPERFFVMALFPQGQAPAGFADEVKDHAQRRAQTSSGGVASKRLAGGATLLYEARAGAPVESFTIAVRAGGRHDGKQPGLAEATSAMMRRLTAKRSRTELQTFLDREGITLSGGSGKDGTTFTLMAPSGKTETMAELLWEVISNPSFAAEEWDAVQRDLIAHVTSSMDQPRAVAENELQAQLYPNTPFGARLEDKKKGLESITPAKLKSFHNSFYRADRMAIVYVGPASRSTVESALSHQVGVAHSVNPPRDQTFEPLFPDRVHRAARPMAGKKQVNMFWSWPGPDIQSDDWILWQLAQRAFGGDLSGRLWQLRQKEGLAYSVWCYNFPFRDRPLAVVYMATAKEKYPQAVSALQREIKHFMAGLEAAELARVKASFITAIERQDRTAVRRCERLAGWWLRGFSPDHRARLRRVAAAATLESVNRVVRETLSEERYVKAEAGAVD